MELQESFKEFGLFFTLLGVYHVLTLFEKYDVFRILTAWGNRIQGGGTGHVEQNSEENLHDEQGVMSAADI